MLQEQSFDSTNNNLRTDNNTQHNTNDTRLESFFFYLSLLEADYRVCYVNRKKT